MGDTPNTINALLGDAEALANEVRAAAYRSTRPLLPDVPEAGTPELDAAPGASDVAERLNRMRDALQSALGRLNAAESALGY